MSDTTGRKSQNNMEGHSSASSRNRASAGRAQNRANYKKRGSAPRDPQAAARRRQLKLEQLEKERSRQSSGQGSKNSRSSKNRNRNSNGFDVSVAIKIVIMAAVIAVAIFLIIFGIKFIGNAGMKDHSSFNLNEDGSIVLDEVRSMDSKLYDISGIKTYAKNLIEDYNSQAGSERIKLLKYKTKKDQVYLQTSYEDYTDYASFTGYWTTVATVDEARQMGYDFVDAFVSVTDDGAKGDVVATKDVLSNGDLKVLILKENIEIVVPGNIKYVSDKNTTVVDSNTVTVEQADGNNDATSLTYIIYE